MSKKAYKNIEYINSEDFFPKDCLRTITPDLLELGGAYGEIPITIELLKDSVVKEIEMPIVFKNAMFIYGFVKANSFIKEIFKDLEDKKAAKIIFHEWDDVFLVVLSGDKSFKEQSYYMSKEAFIKFFNDGLHPNFVYGG